MAEDAVTFPHISHALIVGAEEADALLSGRSDAVCRSRATELRMRIGLLRDDGQLLATGLLFDMATHDGDPTVTDWRLREIEVLPHPVSMAPGAGPLWRRLGSAERRLVSSGAPPEIAEGPSGFDERNLKAELPEGSVTEEEPSASPTSNASAVPSSAHAEDAVGIDGAQDGLADLIASDAESADGGDAGDLAVASGNDGADGLRQARERALAYVPEGMIDTDEAYGLLVRLRDIEIKKTFPEVRPEHGLLRRTMLQALLDSGVSSKEDYDDLIPADLKRTTDRRQIEVYLDPLLEILSRVA